MIWMKLSDLSELGCTQRNTGTEEIGTPVPCRHLAQVVRL